MAKFPFLCFSISFAIMFSSCTSVNWIKDERSGCSIFDPSPSSHETIEYQGDCINGKANGYGKLIWYRNGKPASVNEGLFIKGRREGEIVKKYFFPPIDSARIVYKNGVRNGYGINYYSFGKTIEGIYLDDNPTDSMKIVWKNGKKYFGELDKSNALNGRGQLFFSNGDSYQGTFVKNKRQGKGVYVWSNGDRFIGSYKNDHRESGEYYFASSKSHIISVPFDTVGSGCQTELESVVLRGMFNYDVALAFDDSIFTQLHYTDHLLKNGTEFIVYFYLRFDKNGNVLESFYDAPDYANEFAFNAAKVAQSIRFPISSEEGESFGYLIKIPIRFHLR